MKSPKTVQAGLCIALSILLIWEMNAGEKGEVPVAAAVIKSKVLPASLHPAGDVLEGGKPTWYPLISLKTTPEAGLNRSRDWGVVGTGALVRRFEWGATNAAVNIGSGETRVWTSSYLVPVSVGRVGGRAAGIRKAKVGVGVGVGLTNMSTRGNSVSANGGGANVPGAPTGLRVGAAP